MAKCVDCGLDLSRFGERHRCTTKITGARRPTRLEAEQIARGEMSQADLLPKVQPKASTELGRLAKRAPTEQPKPDQTAAPSREPQPQLSDIMAAIVRLAAEFQALRSVLLPRTDA